MKWFPSFPWNYRVWSILINALGKIRKIWKLFMFFAIRRQTPSYDTFSIHSFTNFFGPWEPLIEFPPVCSFIHSPTPIFPEFIVELLHCRQTSGTPQTVYILKAHDARYPKSDENKNTKTNTRTNTNKNTKTDTKKGVTWDTYDVIYFWKGDDKRILDIIWGRQGLHNTNTKTNANTNTRTTDRPMMLNVFGKEMTNRVRLWRTCKICRICKISKICRIYELCSKCRKCRVCRLCKTCKKFPFLLLQIISSFSFSVLHFKMPWSSKSDVLIQSPGPFIMIFLANKQANGHGQRCSGT